MKTRTKWNFWPNSTRPSAGRIIKIRSHLKITMNLRKQFGTLPSSFCRGDQESPQDLQEHFTSNITTFEGNALMSSMGRQHDDHQLIEMSVSSSRGGKLPTRLHRGRRWSLIIWQPDPNPHLTWSSGFGSLKLFPQFRI